MALVVDGIVIAPFFTPGLATLWLAVPLGLMAYGLRDALARLASNELIRVLTAEE